MKLTCIPPSSTLILPPPNKPLHQESQEIREGIELAIEADVLIPQLDSIFHIRILVRFQQVVQRGHDVISGLHLDRNQGILISDKEINFKSRFV